MGSYYKLPIEIRTGSGASLARKLRRNGKIPANYYYSGEANQNLAIDKKAFNHAIHSGNKFLKLISIMKQFISRLRIYNIIRLLKKLCMWI